MATSYSLAAELGDASFEEPLRYFLTLKLVGNGAEQQNRTDVSPTPTTTPVFRTRAFTFALPPDAEPDRWSLQVSALAVDDGCGSSRRASCAVCCTARYQHRVIGMPEPG